MIGQDTIAAVATPPGRGGVGIVRVSGLLVPDIASTIIRRLPAPRHATLCRFLAADGSVIDQGIALFFPAPRSFTGEPVLELHGHGGPVVMDLLLQRTLECGARLAQAGEFSQRAFLNDRIDLTQAEAIADLIESGTAAAARLAVRSLQGEFSRRVHQLVEQVIRLRLYVEAAIDFPEEEIDFLADNKVSADLQSCIDALGAVENSAQVGRLIRDGMTLVIAGSPNAGKSSLMNALAGRDSAIVTDVPGTTRDVLREHIQLDGIPLHLIDTAGLRDSEDPVEQEGIRRAREQIATADRVLWIFDDAEDDFPGNPSPSAMPVNVPLTLLRNKIDLTGKQPRLQESDGVTEIALSVLSGAGLDLLRDHLKRSIGYHDSEQGEFIARRRHLDALRQAGEYLLTGQKALLESNSGELLAEDLRLAQLALGEITGEFTADDLLGRIFASFCIGK